MFEYQKVSKRLLLKETTSTETVLVLLWSPQTVFLYGRKLQSFVLTWYYTARVLNAGSHTYVNVRVRQGYIWPHTGLHPK